jgi:hypothetical protein
LALVAGLFASALPAAPASAAIPAIACGPAGLPFRYCVSLSQVDGTVRAGALNFDGQTYWSFAGKVELSYHEFGSPGPNVAGRVIAWSDELYGDIPPRGNLTTFGVTHWLPGIYCARYYAPRNGYWHDEFCVDTNGNQWVP